MAAIAFPVFLDLRDRRCLVIGMGREAERKAMLLQRAGAGVRRAAAFSEELLTGVVLVIIADATEDVVRNAACAAKARGILVNVADRPQLCDFIVPSIVDRAPVVVAISTAGAAPALAKMLRIVLERLLPRRLGDLAALAGRFRPLVARLLPDPATRRHFWQRVFRGRVALLALGGRPASRALFTALEQAAAALPGEKAESDGVPLHRDRNPRSPIGNRLDYSAGTQIPVGSRQ